MLKRLLVLTIVFAFSATGSQAADWEIDVAHSSIGFSVSHLVISKVKGSFHDYSATINFEADKLESGTVEMTVQIGSIDTDDAKRDEHLKSPDFFDAAGFPSMTFISKSVHDIDGNKFKITGDLTIRGTTREVVFDAEFRGVVNDPWGNTKAGFSATSEINRQDFGVKWNKSLDAGGVVVGDDVTIELELELAMVK